MRAEAPDPDLLRGLGDHRPDGPVAQALSDLPALADVPEQQPILITSASASCRSRSSPERNRHGLVPAPLPTRSMMTKRFSRTWKSSTVSEASPFSAEHSRPGERESHSRACPSPSRDRKLRAVPLPAPSSASFQDGAVRLHSCSLLAGCDQ
jgi:hypothetical protein